MSSGEQDGEDSGPRHPRNMQGVLRFAVENTAPDTQESASGSSLPLDEERRKFLEQVFSSMTVNVADKMRQSLQMLSDSSDNEEIIDQKENALDELLEWVDNIDFANDFQKLGGLTVLRSCLKSQHSSIRYRTAEVIGELVQNNPYCQTTTTDANFMQDLVLLLDTDADETVRVKSLFALSGLLRDNPAAQKEFSKLDGFSVLLRAMQSNSQKLRVKATFLLRALCTEQPSLKETLCNMGFVIQLVALLQTEHDLTHEHILGALYSLVNDYHRGVTECQRPELNLKATLEERITFLTGKDEFLEEIEYAQHVLRICFNDTDTLQEDR